jgi:hypothetical protein
MNDLNEENHENHKAAELSGYKQQIHSLLFDVDKDGNVDWDQLVKVATKAKDLFHSGFENISEEDMQRIKNAL